MRSLRANTIILRYRTQSCPHSDINLKQTNDINCSPQILEQKILKKPDKNPNEKAKKNKYLRNKKNEN